MQVWNMLHAACCKYGTQKNRQKFAIWAPSHNFVGLYLCNWGTYWQSEKKIVEQQYLLHMSPQYGELWPTSGWDWSGTLGHPSKFQRVSHRGSVTARHSSSLRRPNFAALNRGCHLYLAGRPSRWALAHTSSWNCNIILTMFCGADRCCLWSIERCCKKGKVRTSAIILYSTIYTMSVIM